jgi:hypothetical protein
MRYGSFITYASMGRFNWQAERKKRRKGSVERHTQLPELFAKDRRDFEPERRRFINEFLNNAEVEEVRNKLWAYQESWDTKLGYAESTYKRFVFAQTIFFEPFLRQMVSRHTVD